MQGVIKSKIFIPEEDANMDMIEKYYQVHEFNNSVCSKCPYRKDKPNEYCEACDSYLGVIKLWNKVTIKDHNYITLPQGNEKRASKVTGIDFTTYKDLRCTKPFDYPLKWQGKLRQGEIVNGVPSPNQQEIADKWLNDKRYGFICAPPRTGKSVLSVYIACTLGLKTLIIAHQNELLENFMKSFVRDTNLLQLREETGRDIIKIIKNTDKDFTDDLDVALITYQKFIKEATKDRKIKDYLKGKYGLVIIDEAHQTGANAYAQFLSQLDCRYKLGMSATPMRKDALNEVMLNLIGPVTVKSEATGLIPRIELLETGCKIRSHNMWVYTLKEMQRNKERNKLILRELVRDLKEHKCILLPVSTKEHMEMLVKSINEQFGEEIAIGYHAGIKNRKTILQEIDDGKYKVIVAIYSMIKQGIDLKLPSMIYLQFPMSASSGVGSPMFYQLGNRVATPYQGKREPIIKIFIDDNPESTGCFMSLMTKEIKQGLQAPEGGRPKYKMGKKTFEFAWEIVKKIQKKVYFQNGPYNPEYDVEKKVKNFGSEFGW